MSFDNTPIIVGVGQYAEKVYDDISLASSNVDIAAKASSNAIDDALDDSLIYEIDTVVGVRTFSDSSPLWSTPFGQSNNFPRSVASRIGANPLHAIYEVVGGQSPQKLVSEFSEKLNRGECRMVLIAGGEAIASTKKAMAEGISLDWREEVEGDLEDRGISGGVNYIKKVEVEHKLTLPIQFYGFMEQARRANLGVSVSEYAESMGRSFARMSEVAASNPFALSQVVVDAETLSTPGSDNPYLVSPYTKALVAKDGVNQGAAILMTTVGIAKSLGIPECKWVYLHGYADTVENSLITRENLGRSDAMGKALQSAISSASIGAEQISFFDLYSCFPIVTNEARDRLSLKDDDPRPFTMTGGLPFFGGPGNNYSTHGIVSTVETLRADPGKYGLVYANGGWMTKHSVGVYSTSPPKGRWRPCDSLSLQHELDSVQQFELELEPEGEAIIDSYIVNYRVGAPKNTVIIGRIKSSGKRFYACNYSVDYETLSNVLLDDVIGKTVFVTASPKGNKFAFSQKTLDAHAPKVSVEFRERYEFNLIERIGHTLLVTMNRPEARNALHPMANQELEEIFDAFENDKNLRVAILTGADDKSFSAGNDLKYMASGGEMWVPKTGFAGLTNRLRTKPVIAAVNGHALGGGLEIALACDLVVCADHAQLGLPEPKVGLIAGAGGVQRLTRQVGLKIAMEMLLTAEPVNARKALALNLVNRVVPYSEVVSTALELATMISDVSPMSISSTLKLYNASDRIAGATDAVAMQHTIFDDLLNSEDFYEGSQAFSEKRRPVWKGI